MRPGEIVYLVAVALVGLSLALVSVGHGQKALALKHRAERAVAGVAGKSRDVDPERIRGLIGRGALSDKEAQFYNPYYGPPVPREEEAVPSASATTVPR
jgi:hypothetical protein